MQIPIKSRYSFKEAKWDDFSRELNTYQQGNLPNKSKTEIDTEIAKLYEATHESYDMSCVKNKIPRANSPPKHTGNKNFTRKTSYRQLNDNAT